MYRVDFEAKIKKNFILSCHKAQALWFFLSSDVFAALRLKNVLHSMPNC